MHINQAGAWAIQSDLYVSQTKWFILKALESLFDLLTFAIISRYASEVSIATTWPIWAAMMCRKLSSLSTWQRSATWTQIGKSSLSFVWGVLESKWGRQLEKEIVVVSQMRYVCVRAWILPSGLVKVISNRLLVFNESIEREGWRVSRAQAVSALNPGCLPWILHGAGHMHERRPASATTWRTARWPPAVGWRGRPSDQPGMADGPGERDRLRPPPPPTVIGENRQLVYRQLNRLGLRNNRMKFKTEGDLPTVFEEFIEHTHINKGKQEDFNT